MKKLSFIIATLSLSASALAVDCAKDSKYDAVEYVAKKLKVKTSALQARHLGGETLDGDYESGSEGLYYQPSLEYYDVFLAKENPEKAKAIAIINVNVTEVSGSYDPHTNGCFVDDISEVPAEDWAEIYETYLPKKK